MNPTVRVILCAEDDQTDAEICQLASARLGLNYDFRFVPDADCVKQWLQGQGAYTSRGAFPFPDAIVTDLKMPNSDGLELLRWIRNQSVYDNLPVIVHTSSRSLDDAVFSQVMGVTQYINKDAKCAGLLQYLQKLFGNSELP